jgi:hypothetical protein
MEFLALEASITIPDSCVDALRSFMGYKPFPPFLGTPCNQISICLITHHLRSQYRNQGNPGKQFLSVLPELNISSMISESSLGKGDTGQASWTFKIGIMTTH